MVVRVLLMLLSELLFHVRSVERSPVGSATAFGWTSRRLIDLIVQFIIRIFVWVIIRHRMLLLLLLR